MGPRPGKASQDGIREDTTPKAQVKTHHWVLFVAGLFIMLMIAIAIITTPATDHSAPATLPQPVVTPQATPQPAPAGAASPAPGVGTLLSISNPDGTTNWVFLVALVVGTLVLLNALGFLHIRRGRMLW